MLRSARGGQKIDVALTGRIVADDLETERAFVLQGNGIGALSDFLARHHAAKGMLVRMLPQWSWTAGALSFVYPSQPFVPANVRAFIALAFAAQKQESATENAVRIVQPYAQCFCAVTANHSHYHPVKWISQLFYLEVRP